jgi:quercetin dioxygenase-like cupin family protein
LAFSSGRANISVTAGTGYYQEKGRPVQIIHKGDVIKCLPGIEHWHGATPGNMLTHPAINPNIEQDVVTWLEKVTDKAYNSRQ